MKFESHEISFALELDRLDPLKEYRDMFVIKDTKEIYLDGNSLGRLPKNTARKLSRVIESEWGEKLISSWNEGWYVRSGEIGSKIAKLIGADEGEVIVADSTSVNLFKLITAVLELNKNRRTIISDVFNFPSDLYIIQGIIRLLGNKHELVLAGSKDDIHIDLDSLYAALDKRTAVLVLSHVAFKSSFMYDIKEVANAAKNFGVPVIWDLSHSVGAVPIYLNDYGADLAVGCTYKYLNGGPGSPAFLYVSKEYQKKLSSPIWGWFGDSDPFEFKLNYSESSNINKFLTGTPPIISLSAIGESIDILLSAGMNALREKSILQFEYFVYLLAELLKDGEVKISSPMDNLRRGSHISIKHSEGYRICKALIDEQIMGYSVVPDFRDPDIIRFGITPLYTTYTDVNLAVKKLRAILEGRLYENYELTRTGVT